MNKSIVLFFLFFTLSISGQQTINSKSSIEIENKPEKKVHAFLEHSTALSNSQLDSSLFYADKAMDLAIELGNDGILTQVRAHKGGILVLSKRFDEAEQLLEKNISTSDISPSALGKTYHNLGNSHMLKEEFDKATANYLNAAELFETINDTITLGKTYGNLGVIHARLKRYPKAIYYMDKAIAYTSENEMLKMQLTLNLSGVYRDEGQLDKAISTALMAEGLAKRLEADSALAIIYSNLCGIHLDKEEFDSAIAYGLDALELKQKMNLNTAIVLNNIGYANLRSGDNSKALHYLENALPSAFGEVKSLIYKNLSLTFENLNDSKKALKYAKAHIDIKDSLNLLAQQQNVNELVEKYESEKKQQQLNLLNTKNELSENKLTNQRNLIWGLSVMALLAGIIGFLWYQNQKTKQSLRTTKVQHKLLQTQLNPHFLFNALNSIQAFGYANNKEKLSDYVDSFSKLMRSILESSDQDFITVEEDKKTLEEYLFLQKSSAKNPFEIKISIHSDVNPQTLIPPMFTQPFVENAVLHGIKNKGTGNIVVTYTLENDDLLVTVKDDGSGIESNTKNDKKLHRSMGMDIIRDRVINLQKTHNFKCIIRTDSGEKGTTVQLVFPIRHKKLKQA